MNKASIQKLQRDICQKAGSAYVPAPNDFKVGISSNIRDGALPINGLRYPPSGDTTGWYIYGGQEPSDAPDFFCPLHVEHLDDWCPNIKKFLGLAPGWRFLIAGDYEDLWFDDTLLKR